MGAKNSDNSSEKWVIVKFYTMEYRKCGNSNSKNDSRLWMGTNFTIGILVVYGKYPQG